MFSLPKNIILLFKTIVRYNTASFISSMMSKMEGKTIFRGACTGCQKPGLLSVLKSLT